MEYTKLYFAFIEKFKGQVFGEDEYTEVHHILPRYAGGTDDQTNLVKLSYRQHVFVHKLWWKATGDVQAQSAYMLMNRIPENKKLFLCSQAGKIGGRKNVQSGHIRMLSDKYGKQNGAKNVESGHLASIRHLANTPARQEKLKLLHQEMREDGRLLKFSEAALIAKHIKAGEQTEFIIDNAIRDEKFLHKTSCKNKYITISPEGLEFVSGIAAARYYGNVSEDTIDSWARNNMAGWKRVPK